MLEVNCPARLSAVERASLKTGSFVDLAASTKSRADYTVIATVGIDPLQNIFILNIHRGRWEWPDAYEAIIQEVLAQRVRLVGVEAAGFQLSSFQELIRDSRLKSLAIFPVSVDSDKVSRSLLVSARAAPLEMTEISMASNNPFLSINPPFWFAQNKCLLPNNRLAAKGMAEGQTRLYD